MDDKSVKKKSIEGGLIVLSATGIQYLVTFMTQIILARLLEPALFGSFAFATLVAMLFNNFTNIHGDKYLIKEKDDIYRKFDIIFTLELLLATICFLFVVLSAPLMLDVLDRPDQIKFVQLLAVSFFYTPFSKMRALFERELSFFQAKYPIVISQIIGSIVGVSLAYLNYGVWSLLWWRLSLKISEIVLLFIISPRKPKLSWDRKILKDVTHFGWPLLGSSLLIFSYWNIDYYIIGRVMGDEQLGYYWLAFQLSHYFLSAKDTIMTVVFPAFSKVRTKATIVKGFEVLTKITAAVYLYPMVLSLVLGENLIILLFGSDWIPATKVFQVFMVLTTFRAMTSYWDPIFLYYGKTQIFLMLAAINLTLIGGFGYFATLAYGIIGMSLVVLGSIIIVAPIAIHFLKNIIEVSYIKILGKQLGVTLLLMMGYKVIYVVLCNYREYTIYPEIWATLIFTIAYVHLSYRINIDALRKIAR
jgi:O-antigen/teichoic acid export membrane protein